jgi:hypothetical protein
MGRDASLGPVEDQSVSMRHLRLVEHDEVYAGRSATKGVQMELVPAERSCDRCGDDGPLMLGPDGVGLCVPCCDDPETWA